jgi:hypothetical protein
VRSIKGARKLRTFAENRVVTIASEEDWEACFTRARDRLVVVEFSAVRSAVAVAAGSCY